jgi:TetR/AcrR family transcriptional regulator, fatty acid metabolism regulator protein
MEVSALTNRQQEIVETTMQLVSVYGIQELTMKKIAAELDITEPALYRHFGSKAEILMALIDTLNGQRQCIVADAEKEQIGFQSFAEAFFGGHARLFQNRPAMTLILFSEEIFMPDSDLAHRVHGMRGGTIALLRDMIQKAQKKGELPSDVDSVTLMMQMLGGFRLLVSLWRMENKSFDLEDRTRIFLSETLRLYHR